MDRRAGSNSSNSSHEQQQIHLPFHNSRGCPPWDTLPEELIARILALLPFSNRHLLASVCRKWRSVVWSPLCLELSKLRPSRLPWLLEFQQYMLNQAWAFDLDGQQWFHLSFPFLPAHAKLVVTSGGLVCFEALTPEGYNLFLCNPLKKTWSSLPLLPVKPAVILMAANSASNSYTLVGLVLRGQPVLDNSMVPGSVLVYHSAVAAKEWRETQDMPEELHFGAVHDAVLCNGTVYCLLEQQNRQIIRAFSLEEDAWNPSHIEGPENRVEERFPPRVRLRSSRRLHLNFPAPPQANRNYVIHLPLPPCVQDWYILERHGQLTMITYYGDFVLLNEFDVIRRQWNPVDLSTGEILCASHFSSMQSKRVSGVAGIYVANFGDNRCFDGDANAGRLLPRSPISRNKMQGSKVVIKALWFHPSIDAVL